MSTAPQARDDGMCSLHSGVDCSRRRCRWSSGPGRRPERIETTREGGPSVCIDRINRSYLLIEAETLQYEKVDQ